jgi:serine/threonine-protein kinase
MKTKVFKTDWFTGLAITCVFLIFSNSNFLESIERSAYDYGVRSSSRIASDDIAIIAIDDKSIDEIGRFPWSRDIHAQMYDALTEGGAKVIGQTTFFPEPQLDPGLKFIRELKDYFRKSHLSHVPEEIQKLDTVINQSRKIVRKKNDRNGRIAIDNIANKLDHALLHQQIDTDIETITRQLELAETSLDTDNIFAQSIQKAGNIIFNVPVIHGPLHGKPDGVIPPFIAKNKLHKNNIAIGKKRNSTPLPVVEMKYPIAILGAQADAMGMTAPLLDIDGSIRTEALAINYFGDYYPSMALMLAAKNLNLNIEDIKITTGSNIKLGRLKIKTNSLSMMNTFFYHKDSNTQIFPIDSFSDVLHGNISTEKYNNKIVLIGVTALGIGDTFSTPVHSAMPPVIMLAHSVSSILNEDFFIEPEWGPYARLAALIFIALYIMLVLPKLNAAIGFIVTCILLFVLYMAHFEMMTAQGIWLQLVAPALLLITGHILLTTKHFFLSERNKAQLDVESAESNRMLGLSLQGQGQLDIAFEKFRKLQLNDATLELLYNLALDYERKRQFNKAGSVYSYISDFNSDFRDIKKRAARARSLEDSVLLGSNGAASHGATLILGDNDIEKPTLGRYTIERELGKGSMGAVYLGNDPKISRTVAIKTMALSQEFEEDKLIEVKERFFREAKTAGRLTHPNIVTIYDAGEEQDLAYIAMEFLKGNDLTRYIKRNTLLPVTQVLSIIQRAADGIDYAHRNNVVHRDIKPANIMWDQDTDVLKITDFGIARITDLSKTKTGTILGTPAYMSPEQLSGKKVTGQSDIFSLGILLFQMVTGKLPFEADSMAAVMYKIANDPHPVPQSINRKIPKCVTVVINRAMEKDINKRYKHGKDMASDIGKCLRIINAEDKV